MSSNQQLILDPALRRQTIIDLMRSARRQMMMSLFRCDDSPILDEIVETARRGVDVRVLVTPKAKGWGKRLGVLLMLLKDAGVTVLRYAGPWPKYHAKYVVVDNERALIASLNLTRKCLADTCDFMLVSAEPDLISGLAMLFDFDWNTPHSTLPPLSSRIIVGPDQTRRRVISFLEQAQQRIRIIDHRVTDSEVLLLIARKMQEGVRTETLGRGEAGELASHGKLILIDDRVAVFGSVPLSRQGLDGRREVAVIVEDLTLVLELSRFFDRLSTTSAARPERPSLTEGDDDYEDDDED